MAGFGRASAMGLRIWSMHYIGMLAFSIPMPMFYDPPTVLLSQTNNALHAIVVAKEVVGGVERKGKT
jgi:NO-binding membrane sensor protein with MHYT domain